MEKKRSNSLFDATMGTAEICELVGLFILNNLGQNFGKENIGLYRDDGLAIMKNKSAHLADKARKELHKSFEQFGLKITAEANLHVVNFLDVTFDLNNGKFKPNRKPNDDPLYINRHSSSFLHRSTNAFRPSRQMSKLFMKVLLFTKMH